MSELGEIYGGYYPNDVASDADPFYGEGDTLAFDPSKVFTRMMALLGRAPTEAEMNEGLRAVAEAAQKKPECSLSGVAPKTAPGVVPSREALLAAKQAEIADFEKRMAQRKADADALEAKKAEDARARRRQDSLDAYSYDITLEPYMPKNPKKRD